VFDNKFKEAVEAFRNVLLEVPANPVASNNIATCHVFNNMADKALETLSDLIKMDTLNTVNEQILSNIKELCKVQYADKTSDENYESLVRLVSKTAKESVNAAILQENAKNAAKK
jgi:phosphate uptake regulator